MCRLDETAVETINEAIWRGDFPSQANRSPGYRRVGIGIARTQPNGPADVRTITRHAIHVERSARHETESVPATSREMPVYGADFEGVTERTAQIGLRALDLLEQRMASGIIETRELAQVAGLGLRAVTARKTAEGRTSSVNLTIQSIFGVTSGHLDPQVNQYATIEGEYTDVDLMRAVEVEREELEQLAAGG